MIVELCKASAGAVREARASESSRVANARLERHCGHNDVPIDWAQLLLRARPSLPFYP